MLGLVCGSELWPAFGSLKYLLKSKRRDVDSNQTSLFQEEKALSQNKPTVILGDLLGLFVVVIVIIIVGWAWTYRNLKIRDKNSSNSG